MEVTEWPHGEASTIERFYHLHFLRKGDVHCHTGLHGEVLRFGQEAGGGARAKSRPELLLCLPQERQSREMAYGIGYCE